jgi:hypothetical protein
VVLVFSAFAIFNCIVQNNGHAFKQKPLSPGSERGFKFLYRLTFYIPISLLMVGHENNNDYEKERCKKLHDFVIQNFIANV